MALQKLFTKTVNFYFPTVHPTQLESIDAFDIDQVFIYKRKPRVLMPWRANHLQLTGYPLAKLLAAGDTLVPVTASSVVFTTGPAMQTRDIQFDVELGLKEALLKLGIAVDATEDKKVMISTDFGTVRHVTSNLLDLLSMTKHELNTSHPIVREAMSKGETLFVISSIYSSEKLVIKVQVTERSEEKAEGNSNDAGSENVTKEISSSQLVTRSQATCIGYALLRLTINAQGELTPVLDSELNTNPKIGDEPDGNFHHVPHPKPHSALFGLHQHFYTHDPVREQGFISNTYSGIIMEATQMVAPLVSNKALVAALKDVINSSPLHDKLRQLGIYLQKLNASSVQANTVSHGLDSVIKCISTDSSILPGELAALHTAIEACTEFAPHLVKEMMKLSSAKRDLLLNQIRMMPYGSGTHVFIDEGPYSDPDLYPIMMQSGFSVVAGRLTYQHSSEDDDLLAAMIVVLVALSA